MPSEDFALVDASPNFFLLYSDNGKTFVGASEELKKTVKALYNDRICKALAVANTTWKFNPHMAIILAVSGSV